MTTLEASAMDSPAAAFPPTSLIIPTRGRPALLLDTVQSILDGHTVPTELIVVDQSATHDPILATLTTARDCRLRYHWSPTRGVSRSRNTGIRLASHDLLVLVDDDILVTADWFENLVGTLISSPPKTVVIGQTVPLAGDRRDGLLPSGKTDQAPVTYRGRVSQDVLYTANTALFRSALDQVGLFDERLGPGTGYNGSEDSDLGYRLLRAGYQITYVPSALVYHRAWRASREYLPMRWNYGKGRGAYYAKHFAQRDGYTRWRLRRDVWMHLSPFLANLRRDRRRAWGDVVLVLGLLTGALHWWWDRLRGPKASHR